MPLCEYSPGVVVRRSLIIVGTLLLAGCSAQEFADFNRCSDAASRAHPTFSSRYATNPKQDAYFIKCLEQAQANENKNELLRPLLARSRAGDVFAAYEIAAIYEAAAHTYDKTGRGDPGDRAASMVWYKAAAQAGHGRSARLLGRLATSDAEALKWFDLAASRGEPGAAEDSARIRDKITAQRVAEARAAADRMRAEAAAAKEAARLKAVAAAEWERGAPARALAEQTERDRQAREVAAAAEARERVEAARVREAAEWAALPEEEKERRLIALAAARIQQCQSSCSSYLGSCRSSNTRTGGAAWIGAGGYGGGFGSMMAAGRASRNCDGEYSSCVGSCR